ncbi:Beta-tubulin cofactor D family protein [Trichomonas vaginalis G3]|uniref:Beta-tubulin cofactor D family protein n=1 Tax=Trichomonas vaginalis (strain ATCC PRA-98 / G3) TaxID=412133 RepID=A2DEB5_TRIV3|nr:beta-tubulin cofactor D family [Trichomonas vaginalis G3]EAY21333.1 Beta-tubulin cofactor D family protein [Trichomonas vaginalis G3]KAI5548930.1 beta-tubulin cofactor D family [Trichomonas vaginalis G3]|eukprot:XP_001582319.1 Beta-tubulin cofactor D family protein [Trichomonas vaginalis G3]
MSDIRLGDADEVSALVISENKEKVEEQKPLVNVDDIVQDSTIMIEMAQRLAKNYEDVEAAGTLIELVAPYIEFPQLLDSTLNKLMSCLTKACIESLGKNVPNMIYMCIYNLSNIRGFREILPLFPNQVELFEPVTKVFCQDIQSWEVKFVLCLWLSQLSLVPFDIATIGSTLADDLLEWATKLLSSPTKASESSAFFLSRLFQRKDMVEKRANFIKQACSHITDKSERLVTNYLRTLFYIFNNQDYNLVQQFGNTMYDTLSILSESPSAHQRLFQIKIIQKVGLAFLPPRVAKWRYQRGSRTLNLDGNQAKQSNGPTESASDALYKNEDDFYVDEIVEKILALLFDALESHLTVVRWSASKGIARIVERLPYDDASQTVDYLFKLFELTDNDNLIHGACLTLAQFTLRGIILPSNLPRVISVVMNSLISDIPHGNHTVAESVRDAGCFICWALARSYDGPTLEPYALTLAQQLVNVFLFDRCVNIRRSASAAFQENVGRHGRFPHGLELIHIADFVTVSSKAGCYSRITRFVAQFPEYSESMAKYLVNDRLTHWDQEVRELASGAIQMLALEFPHVITINLVDEICIHCMSIDVDIRHGGLECLGRLLKVRDVEEECLKDLLKLDSNYQIDNVKCSFIRMLAAAVKRGHKVDDYAEQMKQWMTEGTNEVQNAVVDSLNYLNEGEGNNVLDDNFFDTMLNDLKSPGVAAALSSFPSEFAKKKINVIIDSIKKIFSEKESITDTKKNIMESLVYISQFCNDDNLIEILKLGLNDRTTTKKGDEGSLVRGPALKTLDALIAKRNIGKELVIDVLKLCLDKITGIREYAVKILLKIAYYTEDLPNRESVLRLLKSQNKANVPDADKLPLLEDVLKILNKDQTAPKWLEVMRLAEVQNISIEHFNQLIVVPDYAETVVEGLISCSGAFAPDLSKRSRNSLLSFMRKKGTDNAKLVSSIIIQLYTKQWGIVNFQNSLFAFLPLLLGSGVLSGENLADFADKFLSVTEQKYFNKKTPQKLLRITRVLGSLAAVCDGNEMKRAFALLAPLFVCEYANVRDSSANELYSNLKARSVSSNPLPFSFEEAEAVLTKTQWREVVSQEAINKLCGLYGVDAPVVTETDEQNATTTKKESYNYGLLAKSMY